MYTGVEVLGNSSSMYLSQAHYRGASHLCALFPCKALVEFNIEIPVPGTPVTLSLAPRS